MPYGIVYRAGVNTGMSYCKFCCKFTNKWNILRFTVLILWYIVGVKTQYEGLIW